MSDKYVAVISDKSVAAISAIMFQFYPKDAVVIHNNHVVGIYNIYLGK